ncbi:hypothetical protein [Brevundimonas nasdae]|uniref:hypothetical protein n=1 Tax=Brevundimonas nasdae TaxID=172043 RepID=UPI0028A2660E|nr:hypothetical protein [Brevundimonas nasdae]
MAELTIKSLIEQLEVHPNNTAWRAVDACGGAYSQDEDRSGYAMGHKSALASAMIAVGHADGITSALLTALNGLLALLSETGVVLECMGKPTPLIDLLNTEKADAVVEFARAAISRATTDGGR